LQQLQVPISKQKQSQSQSEKGDGGRPQQLQQLQVPISKQKQSQSQSWRDIFFEPTIDDILWQQAIQGAETQTGAEGQARAMFAI